MAQSLRDVAQCHVTLGMPDAAAWYLLRALGWARAAGRTCDAVELLCDLAESCLQQASLDSDESCHYSLLEKARDHAFEATMLARRCEDLACEASTLQRAGRILQRCGDDGDADRLHAEAGRARLQFTMAPVPG
jgi:hypothetical protein